MEEDEKEEEDGRRGMMVCLLAAYSVYYLCTSTVQCNTVTVPTVLYGVDSYCQDDDMLWFPFMVGPILDY